MALGATTSIRDRTPEFFAITESLQTTLKASNKPQSPSQPLPQRSQNKFTLLSTQVAKKIQETSLRLTNLTKLAQRKSLFDDPTREIQQLTLAIKQDIDVLNSQLNALQGLKNDYAVGIVNRQTMEHANNVIGLLKGKLLKIAGGFKNVMKLSEESLEAQRNRRSQFVGSANSPFLDFNIQQQQQQQQGEQNWGGSNVDLGMGSLGANMQGGMNGQPQQQQNGVGMDGGGQGLSLMQAPQGNMYQTARADAVKQVESTVIELEQIFNQLATMVSEQGELVERIDANVEDTVTNMNAGHNQLIQYFNSISGNRSLILKVFGVLMFFLVLWTITA